ncbi:DUF4142 domain-containing protein [Pedobacter xixiisoli]|uniref:DUF4142 domain-containing protein n=1 Tax=Pedobacter xixiisoli TaxID=1476464 RepID=A0A285ZSS5_9SPHI|nr:DUF4142 domain-containing protein [Pedobacter xixiisoli]SOD12702.1 protein of unknown function [Pedobacter xixiisoli]
MINLNKMMIVGATTALLFATSCSSPEREHRDKSVEEVDSTIDDTNKAKVNTADIDMDGAEKAFILSVHSQNLYVSELTNLAAKSKHAGLKSFAKKIAPSYIKLTDDIEMIAKGKGVLLERKLSDTQQKEINSIKELSSPTLDQQILQKLQSFQAAYTTLFEEAKNLSNTDLTNYAKNASTVIKAQQAETTKLINEANETGSQSTRPGEVAIK